MSTRRLSTKSPALLAMAAAGAALAAGAAVGASRPTKAQMLAGKKVYASAGCGKCHALKSAHSTGSVGPNLNNIKPPMSKIVNQVTNGGRFMPPFGQSAGGSLTATQIKNVSAFVYGAEHHLIS